MTYIDIEVKNTRSVRVGPLEIEIAWPSQGDYPPATQRAFSLTISLFRGAWAYEFSLWLGRSRVYTDQEMADGDWLVSR